MKSSFTCHWGINHPLHPVDTYYLLTSERFHGSEKDLLNLLNLSDQSIENCCFSWYQALTDTFLLTL